MAKLIFILSALTPNKLKSSKFFLMKRVWKLQELNPGHLSHKPLDHHQHGS